MDYQTPFTFEESQALDALPEVTDDELRCWYRQCKALQAGGKDWAIVRLVAEVYRRQQQDADRSDSWDYDVEADS